MERLLKQVLLGCVLLFALSTQVIADALSDAQSAFEAGDHVKAVTLFLPLAEQGNAVAQFNLGVIYSQGRVFLQDYPAVTQWYQLSANQGYAPAQVNLGILYLQGLGVKQDFKEAIRWFQLAAKQNNALAQLNLGDMYALGYGVLQDYDSAIQWYRLAADQGNALAQYKLGLLYSKGQGVSPNLETAYTWLNLAVGNATDTPTRNKYLAQRDLIAKQLSDQKIAIALQEAKTKAELEALAQAEIAAQIEAARIKEEQAAQLEAARIAAEKAALAEAAKIAAQADTARIKEEQAAQLEAAQNAAKQLALAKAAEKAAQAEAASINKEQAAQLQVSGIATQELALADTANKTPLVTQEPNAVKTESMLELKSGTAAASGIRESLSGGMPVRIEDINFVFDSYELNPSANEKLNELVDYMTSTSDVKLKVLGYTDSIGPAKHNLDLSLKRAESIKNYLLEKNIAGDRVFTNGLGQDNPVADNNSKEGRALNRRVEIHTIIRTETKVHQHQPHSEMP